MQRTQDCHYPTTGFVRDEGGTRYQEANRTAIVRQRVKMPLTWTSSGTSSCTTCRR